MSVEVQGASQVVAGGQPWECVVCLARTQYSGCSGQVGFLPCQLVQIVLVWSHPTTESTTLQSGKTNEIFKSPSLSVYCILQIFSKSFIQGDMHVIFDCFGHLLPLLTR